MYVCICVCAFVSRHFLATRSRAPEVGIERAQPFSPSWSEFMFGNTKSRCCMEFQS